MFEFEMTPIYESEVWETRMEFLVWLSHSVLSAIKLFWLIKIEVVKYYIPRKSSFLFHMLSIFQGLEWAKEGECKEERTDRDRRGYEVESHAHVIWDCVLTGS